MKQTQNLPLLVILKEYQVPIEFAVVLDNTDVIGGVEVQAVELLGLAEPLLAVEKYAACVVVSQHKRVGHLVLVNTQLQL